MARPAEPVYSGRIPADFDSLAPYRECSTCGAVFQRSDERRLYHLLQTMDGDNPYLVRKMGESTLFLEHALAVHVSEHR